MVKGVGCGMNVVGRFLSKRVPVKVVRKVKRSKHPALTKAKHGTVILRGKIEEDARLAK